MLFCTEPVICSLCKVDAHISVGFICLYHAFLIALANKVSLLVVTNACCFS